MGKNYAELTEGLDRTKLPAERVSEEGLVPFPNAQVGDLVVVHSRGYHRVAVVLEATPKRVMVGYTTEGAWKEAIKIYEGRISRGRVSSDNHARALAQDAKNYDYQVYSTTQESIEAGLAKHPILGRDYFEKYRQESIERLAKMGTKEEYLARQHERYVESQAASYDEAQEKGPAGFVNITTKSVKRDDVFKKEA